MKTQLELLKHELYGNPANSVADIKFYPIQDGIGTEDVARETRKALKAFMNGDYEPIPLSIPQTP